MDSSNTGHRQTVPSLTGIRGVAALWVFLFHLQAVCGSLPGFLWLERLPILNAGWSGVDLFFVLSGFVLMRAHSHEFARLSVGPVINFAKVRFARVYPVSGVVLLAIVLLMADHQFVAWYRGLHAGNLSLRSFFATELLATRWFLPGVQGDWNQPTWSLSAEILGYAAFPLIAALLVSRSWITALTIALSCIGALALYHLVTQAGLDDIDQRTAVVRMGACFVAGAALARAVAMAPQGIAAKSALLSILAAILILAAALVPSIRILLPFAYAVLVFSLAFGRGHVDRVLSARPTQFLGKISFPIYLVHVMPLLWVGFRLREAHASALVNAGVILSYVAFVTAAAVLLHLAVERPAHRLGRQWANQSHKTRRPDVSAGQLQVEKP